MATRFNTASANRLADSLGTAFDSGFLDIYTGAQPASANDDATGTLLVSIDLPADAFAAAADGVAALSGVWAADGVAAGLAGWGRFRNAGDTLRMDVSVGVELLLDDANISIGETVTISAFTFTQPLF